MIRGRTVLVTGGAGFFGDVLKARLLGDGCFVISLDLHPDSCQHDNLLAVQGDIRDRALLDGLLSEHRVACLFHCAAVLAHDAADRQFLWTSNVEGTENVASTARARGVPKLVFTSSNCLWAAPFHRPVTEDDEPTPREIYGASKWEAEKILRRYTDLDIVIIRTPTIVDAGRLGLLAILFQFIDEGRRVWVVGGGTNRYQFIYAPDLADACVRAMAFSGSGTFNVGADEVEPLRDVYQYVIDRAATGARVASLPPGVTLPIMRLAYWLGVSPLGPYQYRMIAEDFAFDTSRAKEILGWRPSLSNREMLYAAFEYYRRHRHQIESRQDGPAHKRAASMGVIRMLKWIS